MYVFAAESSRAVLFVCNMEATAGSSRQAADGRGSKYGLSGFRSMSKRVCKEMSKERARGLDWLER